MPPVGKSGDLLARISAAKSLIVTDGRHGDVDRMKAVFSKVGEATDVLDVSTATAGDRAALMRVAARDKLPLSFVKGDCAGSASELSTLGDSGQLAEWLKPHQYDLVVIGGGSGGLAAAKKAADLGKKVAVLDFVRPSPHGTSWGLGGTCVNVGCIPKKLMHQAGLLGHAVSDAAAFGWSVEPEPTLDWARLRSAVQDHIGSLNWAYRVQLREKNVTYLNAYGSFLDSHQIKAVNKRGKEELLTADRFLVATGLRPRYSEVPGAVDCCISSDDLFSLPYNPGKTLCVGASYVSLECAGFLRAFGLDVTVMVRSILLRGFDQDMAERVGGHLANAEGVKLIREVVPVSFERLAAPTEEKPGRIRVTARPTAGGDAFTDDYDTVVMAIGRDALTDDLGLKKIGVETNTKNKKLVCRANEQSVSRPWVFGIGDVLDGKPELTPVAIHAGRLLVQRLYSASAELCDYDNVPTTVFTPLEYGSCGLSEEAAIDRFGKDNIEVFHNLYAPLEYTIPERKELKQCYAKLVCNQADDNRVLGLHIVGPNAGEITQGFGIAFKFGAKKSDFDSLVGIHPTCAEVFTTMMIKKSEQVELEAPNC